MTEPSPISIRRVETPEQLEEAFNIRRLVFVAEQQVDEAAEIDGLDGRAGHLLAYAHDYAPKTQATTAAEDPMIAIGTLRMRLVEQGHVLKIERVCVIKAWREREIGRELMLEAISFGQASGARKAKLHAQTHVAEFYRSLGFQSLGPVFEEESIPHIAMYISYDQTQETKPTGR